MKFGIKITILISLFLLLGIILYSIFCNAIDDLLINLRFISAHDQLILSNAIELGKTIKLRTDITFIGLARNSEEFLPNNLKLLDRLSWNFKSSQALFLYGKSYDNTGPIIENWVGLSTHNLTVLDLPVPKFTENFSREQKLSYIRNKGLEFVLNKLPPTKYIMWIDLDILGWDNVGVLDSFQRQDWDVMCAHGIVWYGIYRDVYALRMKGIIEHTNHNMWNTHSKDFNISVEEAKQHHIVYEVLYCSS